MKTHPRLLLGSLLAVFALGLAGCSRLATPPVAATTVEATTATSTPTAEPSATATASSTSTSTTSAPPRTAQVEVDRVLFHIRMLAGTIGVRPAGSEAERAAAKYIAGVLTAQGYDTTIEPFVFNERFDESTLDVAGRTLEAVMLDGSPQGSVTGAVVEAGTGKSEDFAGKDLAGRIALVRRGEIPFATKVTNAKAAGAAAVVVVNDRNGLFGGTLGPTGSTIPVLAIDGSEWDALRASAGKPATARGNSGTRSTSSQNVVGRRGSECRAYIGGHYDSVPAGPGANDNASGTATMLELARVRQADGLCVVAFGAEEVGLRGSQAYVKQHLAGGAAFMLNFDMAGRMERPIIVGDDTLTSTILGLLAKGPDQRLKAGRFPSFASSDHVSFTAVGVPAVTITAGDDPGFIHTPQDTVEHVDQEALAFTLSAGDATLEALLKTLPARLR